MSDIVSDAVFAQPFQTLTTTENRYILHLVHRTYEWIGIIFQAPKIAKFGLDSYMIRGLSQDRQQLRSIFGNLLRSRISRGASYPDILSVYSDYVDPDNGEHFSESELGAEALLLFGAGKLQLSTTALIPISGYVNRLLGPDATSTSLASAFFYLARNSSAYERVCNEVRNAFQSSEDILPGPKLSMCVYLRACLDEAMRMNPVNGGALWREVLPGGAIIDGNSVPAGIDVGVGIYSIHHQKDYYPDPYIYRPERWIVSEDNSKDVVEIAHSAWAPYSIGPRGCVGKPAAILQLTISLARVVFELDMRTPADPDLIKVGQGVEGERFPRNLATEFQAKGTFSSILNGPMLEFKWRET